MELFFQMIADSNDEQTAAMWSMANELLSMTNKTDNRTRLEEFQKRYHTLKRRSSPSSLSVPATSSSPSITAMKQSQKTKRRQSSVKHNVISPVENDLFHVVVGFCDRSVLSRQSRVH